MAPKEKSKKEELHEELAGVRNWKKRFGRVGIMALGLGLGAALATLVAEEENGRGVFELTAILCSGGGAFCLGLVMMCDQEIDRIKENIKEEVKKMGRKI